MRPLGFILRTNSPTLIVRESLWRIRKQWAKEWFRIRIRQAGCPVGLRRPAYYQPDVNRCSAQATTAILGFADLICCGQFPFLGYGAHLGFPPRWNLDFVSGKDWPPVPG